MGTLSGGNGGGWPPDELPELPPEWGTIVIPDDASELTQEASQVRRELRWQARDLRWRRRLHLPRRKARSSGDGATSLGVPLLVILIATIATLTSLFVISWPTRPQQPDLPTSVATPSGGTPTTGPAELQLPSPQPAPPEPATAVTPHALGPVPPRWYDPARALHVHPATAIWQLPRPPG
jgi:hypothetical protein